MLGLHNRLQVVAALLLVSPAALSAQITTPVWIETVGGSSDDDANGFAVDANGNAYVSGFYHGTVDFDPSAAVDSKGGFGGEDIFVTKFDADGTYQWTNVVGGSTNDNGTSIAVSADGHVFVSGYFNGTVDFDPGAGNDAHSSNGNLDAFVSKYDSDEAYCWTKTFGGSGGDFGHRVAVDANGNVFVAGAFRSTVDFDPGSGVPSHTSAGGADAYVAKFNSIGDLQWVNSFGGTGNDTVQGLAVDSGGSIFMAGDFRFTADLYPDSLAVPHTSVGDRDAFIFKFDPEGNLLWSHTFGGTGHEESRHAALDEDGNFYVAGEFHSASVDFDPTAGLDLRNSNGSADAFCAKYDSAGNYQFVLTIGGAGTDVGTAVTVNASGTIFVTGTFSDTVDFDPDGGDAYTSLGGLDGFISSFDALGAYLETGVIGGPGFDFVDSVAFDAADNVFVAGGFSSTADLDPTLATDNHSVVGARDFFVLKIAGPPDADGDGVPDDEDICPGGDDNIDTDGDTVPDFCDPCPDDVQNDADGDGICESDDNCPTTANSGQTDTDGDGAGDACDLDIDGDGVDNETDNCAFDANPDQQDTDGDGAGDVCDADIDDDGVVDADDACVPTALGDVVNAEGCSVAQICPCEHPSGDVKWKNHGGYVSCVAHAAEDFVAAGLITEEEKDAIVSAAAESACGHRNR